MTSETSHVLSVTVRPDREVVWVQPVGELDLAAAPELCAHVDELLAVGFERLIIDLRGLCFIDVAGLRSLLELSQRARDEGWRLGLVPGNSQVTRLFALARVEDQLPLNCSF